MLKIINLLENLSMSVNIIEKNKMVSESITNKAIQICLSLKSPKNIKNLSKTRKLE